MILKSNDFRRTPYLGQCVMMMRTVSPKCLKLKPVTLQKCQVFSDKQCSFGIFSKTSDSSLIEAGGIAGLDFIIIDLEHGPLYYSDLINHIRACNTGGTKSIVRVEKNDPNLISKALDAGANGIQVPNISDSLEASKAVKSSKFFPKGSRGVCRFVRAADYGAISSDEYFKSANETKLILQVEGKEGCANIDKIIKVEGIDCIFMGPYDLSQSLGIPGQINHPEVLKYAHLISSKCKTHGIKFGVFVDSEESALNYMKIQVDYLAYSVDMSIFRNALISIKETLEARNV